MAYSSSQGSSVEGEKLYIETRKFHSVLPDRCPITNKKRFRFRLGMRGEASITEAYEDPPNQVHFITSLVAEGDRIQGSSLSGWTYKAFGPPNVEKCSHTHSGSTLKVSGGALALVEAPSREHLNSADIEARHPPITPVLRGE